MIWAWLMTRWVFTRRQRRPYGFKDTLRVRVRTVPGPMRPNPQLLVSRTARGYRIEYR